MGLKWALLAVAAEEARQEIMRNFRGSTRLTDNIDSTYKRLLKDLTEMAECKTTFTIKMF